MFPNGGTLHVGERREAAEAVDARTQGIRESVTLSSHRRAWTGVPSRPPSAEITMATQPTGDGPTRHLELALSWIRRAARALDRLPKPDFGDIDMALVAATVDIKVAIAGETEERQLPATVLDEGEFRECHICGTRLAGMQAHLDAAGNAYCMSHSAGETEVETVSDPIYISLTNEVADLRSALAKVTAERDELVQSMRAIVAEADGESGVAKYIHTIATSAIAAAKAGRTEGAGT